MNKILLILIVVISTSFASPYNCSPCSSSSNQFDNYYNYRSNQFDNYNYHLDFLDIDLITISSIIIIFTFVIFWIIVIFLCIFCLGFLFHRNIWPNEYDYFGLAFIRNISQQDDERKDDNKDECKDERKNDKDDNNNAVKD